MNPRYRLLFVVSHPVQYASPLFRRMAGEPRLDLQVAYCSLKGAQAALDQDFGVEVCWDIPLLDGYAWVDLSSGSSLDTPRLRKMIQEGRFSAVISTTGYRHPSFWPTGYAAKASGAALLFGTDAHALRPRDGAAWKVVAKRLLWPALFRLADVVLLPSTASFRLFRSLGFPEERLALAPFVVNNEWWSEQAAHADRGATRASWGMPEDGSALLFCAKLQPWKRPQDVLEAFVRLNARESYLIYAGEGPLRETLEQKAQESGVADRVRFLGFVNQSQLPAVYHAADLLVLSSEYEPFGLVVNEAMLCGCPAVVSDAVGAHFDLIAHGENGFVYPCGDIAALTQILRETLPARTRLAQLGAAARRRMETWSLEQHVAALVEAVERAVHHKPSRA
jgi:glycosyltransferase involved in cell wall biosynthesis